MTVFLFKLIVTPIFIGSVTLAGRRWGPAFSGLLMGLPLTSGPISIFLALQYGPAFAARAVVGNLALVAPCVLLISGALWFAFGAPMISVKEADHVLRSLTLFGPTALFAALTGVLLFASSIIAGWAENWFVLHRLDSALRYNPKITAALGARRAGRWAHFMRDNVSGLTANVSLGLMFGLIPAFATFFGLELEVRHVTLSTGQLAAVAAIE